MQTLNDLYSSLDWSNADMEYAKWRTGKGVLDPDKVKYGEEDEEAMKLAWRATLLMHALPKEMIPAKEQMDWTVERNQEARWQLNAAGVWPMVVKWLIDNNLIEEKKDVEADRGGSDPFEGGGGSGGPDNHPGHSEEAE